MSKWVYSYLQQAIKSAESQTAAPQPRKPYKDRPSRWKTLYFVRYIGPLLYEHKYSQFHIRCLRCNSRHEKPYSQALKDQYNQGMEVLHNIASSGANQQDIFAQAKKVAEAAVRYLDTRKEAVKQHYSIQQNLDRAYDTYVLPLLKKPMNRSQFYLKKNGMLGRKTGEWSTPMSQTPEYQEFDRLYARFFQIGRRIQENDPKILRELKVVGMQLAAAANKSFALSPSESVRSKKGHEITKPQAFFYIIGPAMEERYSLDSAGLQKFLQDISIPPSHLSLFSKTHIQWKKENKELFMKAMSSPPHRDKYNRPSPSFQQLIDHLRQGHQRVQQLPTIKNRPYLMQQQREHQEQIKNYLGKDKQPFPPQDLPIPLTDDTYEQQYVLSKTWSFNYLNKIARASWRV